MQVYTRISQILQMGWACTLPVGQAVRKETILHIYVYRNIRLVLKNDWV